jgi:hypothetical protein
MYKNKVVVIVSTSSTGDHGRVRILATVLGFRFLYISMIFFRINYIKCYVFM